MPTFLRPGRIARGAALLAALAAAVPAASQGDAAGAPRSLTLEEALGLAEDASEAVQIARAGLTRARGELLRARSERLPQVSGSLSYTRALASEFEGFGGAPDGGEPAQPASCGPYSPDPSLPLEARVDSLERAVRCAAGANPFAGLELPFGRENTWRMGLGLSAPVYTGGRVRAQNRIAEAGRALAEIELASQRARLALEVAEAYYDAALAGRLAEIAEATLAQADTTLAQARLALQVGTAPEFDVLRAQVQRDNQVPLVLQRRADRRLAHARLALLLDLPDGTPLALGTPLDDAPAVPVARFASDEGALGDTAAALRAPVRQAESLVEVSESALRIARSQRLPNLSVVSQYGRVAYPDGSFPAWDDFRANWTVGAQLSVPLFTGGRIRGDQLVAEANLLEARARVRQAYDAARLDARSALERLDAARAQYRASTGTVEQARRAYAIAEVRYREGLSTQVELADSRILLQQAQANRAVAARDLQIARVRAALLPFLPFAQSGARGAPERRMPQQDLQQPRRQAPAADSQDAFTSGGE